VCAIASTLAGFAERNDRDASGTKTATCRSAALREQMRDAAAMVDQFPKAGWPTLSLRMSRISRAL
jgi:hypothetical protein